VTAGCPVLARCLREDGIPRTLSRNFFLRYQIKDKPKVGILTLFVTHLAEIGGSGTPTGRTTEKTPNPCGNVWRGTALFVDFRRRRS